MVPCHAQHGDKTGNHLQETTDKIFLWKCCTTSRYIPVFQRPISLAWEVAPEDTTGGRPYQPVKPAALAQRQQLKWSAAARNSDNHEFRRSKAGVY